MAFVILFLNHVKKALNFLDLKKEFVLVEPMIPKYK